MSMNGILVVFLCEILYRNGECVIKTIGKMILFTQWQRICLNCLLVLCGKVEVKSDEYGYLAEEILSKVFKYSPFSPYCL